MIRVFYVNRVLQTQSSRRCSVTSLPIPAKAHSTFHPVLIRTRTLRPTLTAPHAATPHARCAAPPLPQRNPAQEQNDTDTKRWPRTWAVSAAAAFGVPGEQAGEPAGLCPPRAPVRGRCPPHRDTAAHGSPRSRCLPGSRPRQEWEGRDGGRGGKGRKGRKE